MIVEPEAFIYPTTPPVASVSDMISPVLYECATSASDDTDLPAMPPVPYVATPLLDDSTFPLFAHLSTVPPQFSPTIPPTLYVPEISAFLDRTAVVVSGDTSRLISACDADISRAARYLSFRVKLPDNAAAAAVT